jgi:hypothetical protein
MRELRDYADALTPDTETLDRIRDRARTAYLAQIANMVATPVMIPTSFIGRRPRTVLLGILLFAAMFGDLKLCASLSVFGLGSFAPRANFNLGDPFVQVSILVGAVAALELAFALGIWAHRVWARPLGIAVETASIALAISWVLTGAPIPLQALSIAVSAAVLAGLAHPRVRAAMSDDIPFFARR